MSKTKKVIFVTAIAVLAFMALGVTAVLASPVGQGIEEGSEGERPNPPIGRELLQQIFDRQEIQTVIADALGLTVEEFEAARASGVGLQQLADEQGVPLEDIQAAIEAYKADAVQEALEQEIITEAQAEWLLSHNGRAVRVNIRRRAANLLRNIIEPGVLQETTADTLGLSVEELEAGRQAGLTIPELAEEQGVSLETLREALQDAFAEMVEQAVEDGTITQFQADRILNNQGRQGRMIIRPFGPPGG